MAAQAAIHEFSPAQQKSWLPAYAGMTAVLESNDQLAPSAALMV